MSWVIRDEYSYQKNRECFVGSHIIEGSRVYLYLADLSKSKRFKTKQHALGYKGGLLSTMKKFDALDDDYNDLKENLEVVNVGNL